MSPEVREALESVAYGLNAADRPRRRGVLPEDLRHLVYSVVQELPSEMTLAELSDELCIGSAQGQHADV